MEYIASKTSVAPRKGLRIPESEKFLPVESGIWNPQKILLAESGIQLNEYGISLTIRIQNPSSTIKHLTQVPGIWNPWREIQNPRLPWIPVREVSSVRRSRRPNLILV